MNRTGLIVPELLGCPRCDERNMDDLVFVDADTSNIRCTSCNHEYNAEQAFLERHLGP